MTRASELIQTRIRLSSDTPNPLLCKTCYISPIPLLQKNLLLDKLVLRVIMGEDVKGEGCLYQD